ncbi:MAG TPA: glycine betaine ABC transporter substrate-binding protein [Chthonomonadaceae bacterium]|nr:glycine betaine ABC transporter substrate-binding protein [Chthonomonadaceae bacterium]
MRRLLLSLLILLALCGALTACRRSRQVIIIGSKKFTESYVLGEIAKKLMQDAGFTVEHRQGMGATGIVWGALKAGGITMYPEYTGTISEEILKLKGRPTEEALRAALSKEGIGMTGELGFNNTYALVMRRDKAEQLGIRKISDLRDHPDLIVRPSPEFLKRKDGWEPLSARYGLAMRDVGGMEHELGYAALAGGKIDVMDAYSTDAKIAEFNLVVLEDDLGFFPQYKAVFLYRLDAPPKAVAALGKLVGTISGERMTRLNAEAERTKNYAQAAALYFTGAARRQVAEGESFPARLARWTGRHLELVGISLFGAILLGIPLGILASRPGLVSQLILGVTGVIQTIPSIALLTMLIAVPFLGIGVATAIVALFLYSLLPIVRNTAAGLQDIPPPVRESAAALGLEPPAQLRKVYLPMASRTILAGIKTSAIINVGTATLAAFIGAGGLGEPIVSGLALNDTNTVLQGAIPAAILALIVQFAFDLLDRLLIPKGLRLPAVRS